MNGSTNASNIGGTVGDDTHPIKIVNDVPTPVTNELQTKLTPSVVYNDGTVSAVKYGKIVVVSNNGFTGTSGTLYQITGLPKAYTYAACLTTNGGIYQGDMWIEVNNTTLLIRVNTTNQRTYGSLVYITLE